MKCRRDREEIHEIQKKCISCRWNISLLKIAIADLLYQISADCPDQIIKVVFRVCRVFVLGRRYPKAYVVYALGHFANFLNGLKVLHMETDFEDEIGKRNLLLPYKWFSYCGLLCQIGRRTPYLGSRIVWCQVSVRYVAMPNLISKSENLILLRNFGGHTAAEKLRSFLPSKSFFFLQHSFYQASHY